MIRAPVKSVPDLAHWNGVPSYLQNTGPFLIQKPANRTQMSRDEQEGQSVEGGAVIVFVYVNTGKQVGVSRAGIKVYATRGIRCGKSWFEDVND